MSAGYFLGILFATGITAAWALMMFGPNVSIEKIRAEAQARKLQ